MVPGGQGQPWHRQLFGSLPSTAARSESGGVMGSFVSWNWWVSQWFEYVTYIYIYIYLQIRNITHLVCGVVKHVSFVLPRIWWTMPHQMWSFYSIPIDIDIPFTSFYKGCEPNQPGSCQEVAPDLTREIPVHPTNTWLPQLAQKSGCGLVLDGDFGKKR